MNFESDDTEEARTIFCGNLANKVTEELLYELFLQAGPLTKVSIPTDRDGRLASYGFVTFKHRCSVDYALKLFDGVQLYNCRLNLKPRKQENNSGQNSSVPLYAIQMPMLIAPLVQMPFLQFNNMSPVSHQTVPLAPVHNNLNRTPSGRNDQYRNESLQGRFAGHSSKRDRDNMRPNNRHDYKRHKR